MHRLLNPFGFAAGQLAVFQGASEAPISESTRPSEQRGKTANRTPEQILCSRVTSSQFMFHDSLQNERDLGINFWEKECPVTEGMAFTIPGPGNTKALFWEAKLDRYAFQ